MWHKLIFSVDVKWREYPIIYSGMAGCDQQWMMTEGLTCAHRNIAFSYCSGGSRKNSRRWWSTWSLAYCGSSWGHKELTQLSDWTTKNRASRGIRFHRQQLAPISTGSHHAGTSGAQWDRAQACMGVHVSHSRCRECGMSWSGFQEQ